MASNDDEFVTRWRAHGTLAEVNTILGDAASLPRWWPSVSRESGSHADRAEDPRGSASGIWGGRPSHRAATIPSPLWTPAGPDPLMPAGPSLADAWRPMRARSAPRSPAAGPARDPEAGPRAGAPRPEAGARRRARAPPEGRRGRAVRSALAPRLSSPPAWRTRRRSPRGPSGTARSSAPSRSRDPGPRRSWRWIPRLVATLAALRTGGTGPDVPVLAATRFERALLGELLLGILAALREVGGPRHGGGLGSCEVGTRAG